MKEMGGRQIVLGAVARILVRRLRVEAETEEGMVSRGCSERESARHVYITSSPIANTPEQSDQSALVKCWPGTQQSVDYRGPLRV